MTSDSIRNVIAVRELTAGILTIRVTIGAPEKISAGEFRCSYAIEGGSKHGVRHASGQDAVQALYLALVKIGTNLYNSNEAKAGELMWLGSKDIGFPVPTSQNLTP